MTTDSRFQRHRVRVRLGELPGGLYPALREVSVWERKPRGGTSDNRGSGRNIGRGGSGAPLG